MKKLFSLILAFAMLLGLCACAGSAGADNTGNGGDASTTTAAPQEATFMVGFGKADITPPNQGIKMGGYGNQATRRSTGLLSYIYAITVAVTDEKGNTALMMSVDNCSLGLSVCTDIRNWAESEYGIPVANVLISSIHQHSTPDTSDGNYKPFLMKQLKASITKALEDRAPAEMYGTTTTTEAMNFVRRAWYKDGGFVTSHSGDRSSGFDHYESEADPEMRLIKFTREGKEDIIMVNFQCHPHMGTSSSSTDIHSDWPGVMRDMVTEKLGAHCIYFSGAGGNMNSTSYEPTHMITTPKDNFKQHGQRAARYVINAEDTYTKLDTGLVLCKEVTNTYEADHSLDYLYDVAAIVHGVRKEKGMDAAHAKAKEYPELNSAYQASAVVEKHSLGATKDCTISVITFGDVAFSAHPYEMFDTNGKELREGTVGNANYAAEDQLENPFAMTFITTQCNGGNGYMPSLLGFTNGGYERDTTKYARGTGELLVGDYLHLLNELYTG